MLLASRHSRGPVLNKPISHRQSGPNVVLVVVGDLGEIVVVAGLQVVLVSEDRARSRSDVVAAFEAGEFLDAFQTVGVGADLDAGEHRSVEIDECPRGDEVFDLCLGDRITVSEGLQRRSARCGCSGRCACRGALCGVGRGSRSVRRRSARSSSSVCAHRAWNVHSPES